MLYPDLRTRVRAIVVALAVPLGAAAFIACDAGTATHPDVQPELAYADDGEPELAWCSDPTPLQKWSVIVGPAGGTFTMGPNTLIVPAGAVSASASVYLRELSSSSLTVRLNSSEPLELPVEVIMATSDCDIGTTQTVWLYDEASSTFDDLVPSQPDTQEETMRFWTIQPGAYALAN